MTMNWPSQPPVLGGELVALRPWRSDDADAVFDACQDPDTQHWTNTPVPYLRDHAVGFVDEYAPTQWASQAGTPFCIASELDDTVLGSCEMYRIDADHLVAEVGYWVAPWARGRHVGTESLSLLTTWALDEVGMHRLELLIDPDNAASRALAERVGCVLEGVMRGKIVARGERRDLALYALVR